MLKTSCLTLLLMGCLALADARPQVQLRSPDGQITYMLETSPACLQYGVTFRGVTIVSASPLGMVWGDARLQAGTRIKKVSYSAGESDYRLVVGKTSKVQASFQEALVWLTHPSLKGRVVQLHIRAYNDGIAFRYQYPEQDQWTGYDLWAENTSFRFVSNPRIYTLLLDSYTTSHEGLYTTTWLDSLPASRLLDVPTVLNLSDSCWVAITEANLRNYAGMYLQKQPGHELITRLSPLPGQADIKVKASIPHHSPWRVMMISDRIGGLMESNLLTSLCDPPTMEDLSWIRPGKTTWSWWNGDIYKEVPFEVGQNVETHQFNIDFCAAHGIAYHAIIEHGNRAWYYGEGEGFDPPPPHADVTRPVAGLDMDRLAAYSREKGVGLRLWVHWRPLSEKLEEAFAQYQRWNVQGLMIDFMDRDDQEMVLWVEEVLEMAAKYHLHVQFHGAYKPTGLSRTYPHEFTKEGVLNLENLKWGRECDPEHNLMVPFTRMIAGPMDYHTGGFRAVPREIYQGKFYEPNVLGTRCHHLAMYVVYESYLQMVSDYPQAYENQPGFEFVSQVPTVWDEMRVLLGQIGDYVAIARRSGDTWYIGVMNDWTPRSLVLPLDFLPTGTYELIRYEDGPAGEQAPNELRKVTEELTDPQSLTVNLASGGGQAIWIRQK